MLNRKLSVEEDFQLISEELTKIFNSNYLDKLARKELFLKRARKLSPLDFVSLCVFFNHHSGTKSLTQLCAVLASTRNVSLSTEGLNLRYCKEGVNLLKKVFQELFTKDFLSHSLPNLYYPDILRIRILDSSGFELPCLFAEKYVGYHKSGVKIQLEYELLSGEFLHCVVQNGRDSDMAFGPTLISTIQKKDLIMRDLGYLSFDELEQIDKKEAYYISRLRPQIVIYVKDEWGQFIKLDLQGVMKEMDIGEVREIENIYVGKKKLKIPRLILCKLTDEQTKQRLERRKKQQSKKGVKYSHQTLNLSRLSTLITNIPQQSIPKEELQSFYSLRWQIELLFKTWKSLFHIHEVKKMKVERFECHLYGTFIALLITSTLAFKIRELLYMKKRKEISEYLAISIIRQFITALHKAILEGVDAILDPIEIMLDQIEKNGIKSHRYKKKSPFDILCIAYNKSKRDAA
ncbi:IS4 family transposase [Niallia endozanthoxylica]|uniref:IS4 family transposase n=1 Tax=Niallia endozanthoxylica TaxID=2036016 RepID=A0A5J5HPZ7_9BACI|nr:IS4 family transposase [Niallia endozanthoxylica]KAA9023799.1 IS4 family transposase [Niallia endozanthoxylica]